MTPRVKHSKAGKVQRVAIAGVPLTHPDRVYWPEIGVTKRELAEYYTRVWDRMAPHLVGRPVSLVRCPQNREQCFFQKHATAGLESEHLQLVPERGKQSFIAVAGLRGLIALAQAGVLEIHAWGTTVDALDTCDRLVIDLDPGPGVGFGEVAAGAREVRDRLAAMDLKSFLKTTGGKGLHVVVPIMKTGWEEARNFARALARAMARDNPGRYTANMAKHARHRRIFVDYVRNTRGATAIVPFSTRAKPNAPVAVPLAWNELGDLKASNAFTVRNIMKRLSRQGRDPWAGMGRLRQRLPKVR
jgi:bifunctional non-homologous end joining protein LigD